jgi:hypothetical protein
MEFGLALEIEDETNELASLVHEASDTVSKGVAKKKYGVGVEHIFIGFIAVSGPAKGHEARPLRYCETYKLTSIFGGSEILHNVLFDDIKIDIQVLKEVDVPSQRRIISKLILGVVGKFADYNNFFPLFDAHEFYNDVSRALDSFTNPQKHGDS